jgi:succinyl-diaminopimelate desuccinylase
MPERGVNAIYKAARAVLRLEAFDFGLPEHPILGRPTVNVGTISGGLNVNSVPDLVRIGIDLRSIPGLDHDALLVRVRKTLGAEIDLKSTLDASWVWTDPGEPWVGEAFSLITPFLGETPEPRSVSYFTDASVLRAALGNPPTLILGPGEAALAHQTDEYCRIDRVEQATDIFETLMSRWCE